MNCIRKIIKELYEETNVLITFLDVQVIVFIHAILDMLLVQIYVRNLPAMTMVTIVVHNDAEIKIFVFRVYLRVI